MTKSRIDWTEYTWNPITGCSPVSEGCEHCYAKRMSERFYGAGSFAVQVHQDRLDDSEPQRSRKSKVFFVSSMGDLFHDEVPDAVLQRVFDIMYATSVKGHTFLLCTKRVERMAQWATPASHIWYGVTAENQRRLDERVSVLQGVDGIQRFISAEPLLSVLDISAYAGCLGWVIAGGETGPGARPMQMDWPVELRDQCVSAGIPFFFKSWGAYAPVNGMMVQTSQKDHFLEGVVWNQVPFDRFHAKPLTGDGVSVRYTRRVQQALQGELSI